MANRCSNGISLIYWASSDKALNEDSPVISLGQTLRHRTKEEKDDWFCVVNPNALTNVVGQTLWVKLEMIHQLLITVESKGALTPLINQWSLTLNLRETCTAETYRQTYSNIKLSDEERSLQHSGSQNGPLPRFCGAIGEIIFHNSIHKWHNDRNVLLFWLLVSDFFIFFYF